MWMLEWRDFDCSFSSCDELIKKSKTIKMLLFHRLNFAKIEWTRESHIFFYLPVSLAVLQSQLYFRTNSFVFYVYVSFSCVFFLFLINNVDSRSDETLCTIITLYCFGFTINKKKNIRNSCCEEETKKNLCNCR